MNIEDRCDYNSELLMQNIESYKNPHMSITKAIFMTFKTDLIVNFAASVFENLLGNSLSVILYLIVREAKYLYKNEAGEYMAEETLETKKERFHLVLAFYITAIVIFILKTFLDTKVDFERKRLCLRISNCLKATVLRKILELRSQNRNRLAVKLTKRKKAAGDDKDGEADDEGSKNTSSAGCYLNLIQVDSEKFEELAYCINKFINSVISTIFCFGIGLYFFSYYFLIIQFLMIIGNFPLDNIFAKMFENESEWISKSDSRLSYLTELLKLKNLKFIKSKGKELPFLKKLTNFRLQEMECYKKHN